MYLYYLLLDPLDFILEKKKNNIHLPVISIVGEIHEHSKVGKMIADTFRVMIRYHLCLTSFTWPTPRALKKNLMCRKESKNFIQLENPSPLHLKRIPFTLLIAPK